MCWCGFCGGFCTIAIMAANELTLIARLGLLWLRDVWPK